jgi:hypothetical protein
VSTRVNSSTNQSCTLKYDIKRGGFGVYVLRRKGRGGVVGGWLLDAICMVGSLGTNSSVLQIQFRSVLLFLENKKVYI